MQKYISIFSQLDYWVEKRPEKNVYTFLDINGEIKEQYTYKMLFERISSIAATLREEYNFGLNDRILLAYPPGLEMICAFYACSRLGLIPVPVYPPSSHNFQADYVKIGHIAHDCLAAAILTNTSYYSMFKSNLKKRQEEEILQENNHISKIDWINTEEFINCSNRAFTKRHSDTLFLQYTSGSTGHPKGVMVSHGNILHNGSLIQDDLPVGVSWLPQYHDMGLIGYYLFSALKGGTTYGFSSLDFILRPALWLETISKYKATASSAPNFAYDYCLSPGKISPETFGKIDLSSLKFLMTAAEPVRPETYNRFLKTFEPYGLKPETYIAAYGLAENTLAVSSYGRTILTVDKNNLKCNQLKILSPDCFDSSATQLMSCGKPFEGIHVKIVHPEKYYELKEGTIGEIWINGESKCKGYWNKPELSKNTFQARLHENNTDANEYLKTGDFGFIYGKELYVCGRLKDMIIIRGLNYYPQDIEIVVEKSSELIRKGCVVAFGIEGKQEQLVIIIGLKNRKNIPDASKISESIIRNLNIQPHSICFIAANDVPKTSSGKIIRYKAKQKWKEGRLNIVDEYKPPLISIGILENENKKSTFDYLKIKYGLKGDETCTLFEADLDSLDLAILIHDIEEMLKEIGVDKLAKEVDFKLIQKLSIAELYTLANQFENATEKSLKDLEITLAKLQRELKLAERNTMLEDTQLTFTPSDLPNDIMPPESKSFLLTGGTGFFGPFILKSLLAQSDRKIYVLVRANDPDEGKLKILNSLKTTEILSAKTISCFEKRVIAVSGDLSQPHLGLTQESWNFLANNISEVYHNGAMVNYLFNYDRMRPANVTGTNEVLKLCFQGVQKTLNHISTTFIFGWAVKDTLYEVDSNTDIELLDFGYSQTKWVSEVLVKQAMKYGLKARIFRPALITPSINGGGNNFDVSIRLLAFMINHGIAVDAYNQVSFTPADVTANNIVAISHIPDSINKTFHVTRDEYANMLDVTQIITQLTGKQFKVFNLPEFVPEVIQRCTKEDILFPLLNFLVRSVNKISSMEFKRYDNSNYKKARCESAFGIEDPTLENTVKGLLIFMKKKGIINVVISDSIDANF